MHLFAQQGMSFEERSDAEEEEGILTDDGSSSIFQSQEQQQHHVLISSTNDIAMLTEVPNYKTIHTAWLGLFMLLLTVFLTIQLILIVYSCTEICLSRLQCLSSRPLFLSHVIESIYL